MTALKEEMCKCADKACADAVHARLQPFVERLENDQLDLPEPSQDELQRMTDLGVEYGKCMAHAGSPP